MSVLILLPPSEGKADVGDGPALDLTRLSSPSLTEARETVLAALTDLCEGPEERALAVLGLSPGQAGELAKDRRLRSASTLPAAGLYTGVLYERLGLSTLGDAAVRRAHDHVIVFSGLWGILRLSDPVPPYRAAIGVRLPPLGGLAAFWRPSLAKILDAQPGLVVDLRSAAYQQAWRPGRGTVVVRVLRQHEGKRTVVSHMAKATRGDVARALIERGTAPSTPRELSGILRDLGYVAELSPPASKAGPWTLDIVINS